MYVLILRLVSIFLLCCFDVSNNQWNLLIIRNIFKNRYQNLVCFKTFDKFIFFQLAEVKEYHFSALANLTYFFFSWGKVNIKSYNLNFCQINPPRPGFESATFGWRSSCSYLLTMDTGSNIPTNQIIVQA